MNGSFQLRPKGTGTTIGYVENDGSVWFQMDELRKLFPFDNEAMRRALVTRLNEVFSREIPEDDVHKRQVTRKPLQHLKGEGALEKLLETLKWVIDEIDQHHP